MTGKVINKLIPHLGLVLMLPIAIPGIICDGEWPTRFEHEGYAAL